MSLTQTRSRATGNAGYTSPLWPSVKSHDPATVAEAIVQHHRVRHFRGGHDKNAAYSNRGKAMTAFPFVQINPQDFKNFLVVDVDREDAELWLLHPAVPEPHWIIQNPANGHAQAGWMIDPVHTGPEAREHPLRYAEAVQAALDELTGSDGNFTRYLVRNPVADTPAGIVRFGSRIEPYTLGDLMSHMQNYEDPFEPDFTAWKSVTRTLANTRSVRARAAVGSRNNTLFYSTRAELWRRFTEQSISPSRDYALDYAHALNHQLPVPLPEREVRELSCSAVRQVLRGRGKGQNGTPDPWLAEMGRKGGSAATETKKAAAATNARKATKSRQTKAQEAAEQARAYKAAGHTIKAIADLLGRCARTIKRYLAGAPTQGDISQATGSDAAAPTPPAHPAGRVLRTLLHALYTLELPQHPAPETQRSPNDLTDRFNRPLSLGHEPSDQPPLA